MTPEADKKPDPKRVLTELHLDNLDAMARSFSVMADLVPGGNAERGLNQVLEEIAAARAKAVDFLEQLNQE